jgi:hypothetical protein
VPKATEALTVPRLVHADAETLHDVMSARSAADEQMIDHAKTSGPGLVLDTPPPGLILPCLPPERGRIIERGEWDKGGISSEQGEISTVRAYNATTEYSNLD